MIREGSNNSDCSVLRLRMYLCVCIFKSNRSSSDRAMIDFFGWVRIFSRSHLSPRECILWSDWVLLVLLKIATVLAQPSSAQFSSAQCGPVDSLAAWQLLFPQLTSVLPHAHTTEDLVSCPLQSLSLLRSSSHCDSPASYASQEA